MKTSELIKDIAIYLEGLKAGRGDLYPLGNSHLQELWKVVKDYQSLELETKTKAKKK